jgi:hypothetical protein
MQMGRMGRVPRIPPEITGDDFICDPRAQCTQRCDIEIHVRGAKCVEVLQGEMEEPDGGAKAAAILWMIRTQELFLEVHKRAGDLDESFIEEMIFVAPLQPEMLEHIVRFVILPRIETAEVALIAWIERARWIGLELFHKTADSLTLFHPSLPAQHGATKLSRFFSSRGFLPVHTICGGARMRRIDRFCEAVSADAG